MYNLSEKKSDSNHLREFQREHKLNTLTNKTLKQ